MSPWNRLRRWTAGIFNATFGRGSESFWRDVGLLSDGTSVNADTALGLSAVWKAANVIGKDIAVLPLHKYRRLEQGKDRLRDVSTRLLNSRPNLYVKAVDWRLSVQVQALLRGNGYAEIQRDLAGQALALWWLPTENVDLEIDAAGLLWYVYRQAGREPRRIRPENMIHIKGPSKDGLTGWSVIALARESLALTLGQERYAKKQYDNGVRPSLILKNPGSMTAEKRKEFRESIAQNHEGVDNAFRFMLLYGGWEASTWNISNEDAQWLEGRQFQVEEVARWFDLPPHKLGAMGRATWNNVESMQLEYVAGCLQFWLTQWQQECDAKLLTERERDADTHFFEFKLDALLRGDTLSRYQVYAIGRLINVLSPNEIREKENMNPRDDGEGDSYENPNTSSPNAPGSPEDKRTTPDDGNKNPRTKNQQRLEVLATTEVQLVLSAAERSKNFCGWVEHAYAEGGNWRNHVEEVFVGCDLQAEDAGRWCESSRSRLLDLTERVTQKELRGAVLNLLADWPLRAEEFSLGATDH